MLNPDFRDILSSFGAEGVEYLVVGAYALAAHGLPRATGDLDLWVNATLENAPRVRRALQRFGAPVEEITEADLSTPDNVLQIGLPPRRVDVLTSIDAVKFAEAWGARLEVTLEGLEVPILGREHLVRNKRAVGRPQDLADAAAREPAVRLRLLNQRPAARAAGLLIMVPIQRQAAGFASRPPDGAADFLRRSLVGSVQPIACHAASGL